MMKQEIDATENALATLARMSLDDYTDLIVQKIIKQLDTGNIPQYQGQCCIFRKC